MDLGKTLATVSSFLEGNGYRYGVIGGVALAMYGMPRATVDLDLVVEAAAQDDLIRFLESLGYQTLHRSSPLKILAMKNDPSRTFQEMADLRFLIALPGVDRQEIHTYFTRHDLEDRFDELNKNL